MSPEQARGKTVDKRADIWAFGVVFYEMLTGRSAFQGEDVSVTLASVIKGDANLNLLPPSMHPRVREVITRCLQNDIRRRYSSIVDARYEIEQALSDPSGLFVQPIAAERLRKKLRIGMSWFVAAAILCLIIGGLAVWYLKPSEPRQVMRFDYELPADQSFSRGGRPLIAVSADGTKIVYVANEQLYLRNLKELTARPIQGTDEDPSNPFFSPDSRWIGYWSAKDGQLKKITVDGGASVTLCDAGNPYGATWGEDDTILFGQEAGVMSVSANGGPAQLLVKIKERELVHGPQLLPRGEWVLFTIGSRVLGEIWDKGQIVVQSLESGERKVLVSGGSDARYLPTGHLVYALGDVLYAKAFNVGSLEVMGGAVPIVKDVQRAASGYTGAAQYGFSDTGMLAYIVGGADIATERNLVWVDRNGKEETVDAPPRAYAYAHLSPDATQVALDIRDQENDIWIWDLARKTLARLTFDTATNFGGIWTPDGKSVAYSAVRNEEEGIWLQAADGSGSPESLIKRPEGGLFAEAFSPDGKQLLVTGGPTSVDISMLSIGADAAPKQLLATKFNEYNATISPDGRWMAYQSDESGRFEIYVRPFPAVNSGRWQISTEGGYRPLWNKNGREIFYFRVPGIMMSVPVETGTSFKAGAPRVLFKGEYFAGYNRTQYSVTPDGRRFLMIKNAAAKSKSALPQQINIVLNWFEELKERIPVK
jgi:Tol biopolymer transport system component